ncbi:MAG: hypothetical protein JNK72_01895 [Myxococcales bacterium]|nr:hypothetical protein [Myxococcales bacterium]
MEKRAIHESVVVMYGVLAGGARLVLPPMVDVPVVKALRTAMVDRMARAYGVTLTAGARRILVDVEESATIRGNVTQGVRLLLHRLVPGSRFVDAGANLFRTWGSGLLLQRYLAEHRGHGDPVLGEIEAERVRAGVRAALEVLEADQLRLIAEEAMVPVQRVDDVKGLSKIEAWSEAVAATMAELPAAWLAAAEQTFLGTLAKYR